MMSIRRLFFLLMFCPMLSFAQYSDELLCNAYRQKDVSIWKVYLDSTDFASLSEEEQFRYLNYEFGYCAIAIDAHNTEAAQCLDAFYAHLSALPTTCAPLYSAYCAFHAQLYPMSLPWYGLRAMHYARKGITMSPSDPLAWLIHGCIFLYAPRWAGGSRDKAIQSFQNSQALYRLQGDTLNNWNYFLPNLLLEVVTVD